MPIAVRRGTVPAANTHSRGIESCGEVEFSRGEGKSYSAAIDAFAAQVDADEAAELARIRRKLKLTQRQAAYIAGGGPNAFSRYERGKAKPVAAVLNLFRILDRHPNLLNELNR